MARGGILPRGRVPKNIGTEATLAPTTALGTQRDNDNTIVPHLDDDDITNFPLAIDLNRLRSTNFTPQRRQTIVYTSLSASSTPT